MTRSLNISNRIDWVQGLGIRVYLCCSIRSIGFGEVEVVLWIPELWVDAIPDPIELFQMSRDWSLTADLPVAGRGGKSERVRARE